MSPKPYMPGDDVEFINGVGIRKKKGKSGNSKKRKDYFLQQRFPHMYVETDAEDDPKKKKSKAKQKRNELTIEEQQAASAPLARVRKKMMQEYKQRVLVQQEELEKSVNQEMVTGDKRE